MAKTFCRRGIPSPPLSRTLTPSHVYEYFLGQFAIAEGKKGGQYFTPKAIVTLIVEMLEPYSGRC